MSTNVMWTSETWNIPQESGTPIDDTPGQVNNILESPFQELVQRTAQNQPSFSGLENNGYMVDWKVIRVPKLPEYNELILKEYRVVQLLEAQNFSFAIPNIQLAEFEGRLCTVYDFIDGKVIDTKTFNWLDETVKEKIIQQMVDVHQEFAVVNVDSIKDQIPDKPSYLLDYDTLIQVKGIFPEFSQVIDEYIKIHREGISQLPDKVLAHCDLHPGNIIFDDDWNIKGIIDFGASAIANPIYNFTHFAIIWDDSLQTATQYYEQLTGESISKELVTATNILFRVGHLWRFQDDPTKIEKTKQKIYAILNAR